MSEDTKTLRNKVRFVNDKDRTYLEKRNSDDVFFRAVTIGVLSELMDKIQMAQVVNGKVEPYMVPIYYSLTGDESWLKDNFTDYHTLYCPDDVYKKVVDGSINMVPRGILQQDSIALSESNMTNNLVRASYVNEVDNEYGTELKTFNSEVRFLPFTISYTLTLKVDTEIQRLKLIEAIYKAYYKLHKFQYRYQGFTLPGNMGLEGDVNSEAKVEFEFPDDDLIPITMNFEVEAYLPIIDPTQERFEGNRITRGFNIRTFDGNAMTDEDKDKLDRDLSNDIDSIFFAPYGRSKDDGLKTGKIDITGKKKRLKRR